MGYNTIFTGVLKFAHEVTVPELAHLKTIFGEDCREHPEWKESGLSYIDLKLADDMSGIQWDDATEKTYCMEDIVNLVIVLMRAKWPEFGLTGTLDAQGESARDRWKLVMVDGVAEKHDIVIVGEEIECPECETIYAIGGLNTLEYLYEVAYLNDICDRLGMDTMSAGNIAGFAIEAFKRGKIDFEIDYNQPDRMARLFALIAANEGVGAIFAEGIRSAASQLGLEDIAIHVKGLEPAGFDPRVLKGMGLSYATAARGACHLRGTFYKAELSGEMDKDQIEGKAALQIDYEDRAALFDCLILCRFFRDFVLWDELAAIIEATTGMALTKDELGSLANKITQQTRAYNTREGLGASSDCLPKRFLSEKTEEGASLETEDLQTMIKEYNDIRNGTVTAE